MASCIVAAVAMDPAAALGAAASSSIATTQSRPSPASRAPLFSANTNLSQFGSRRSRALEPVPGADGITGHLRQPGPEGKGGPVSEGGGRAAGGMGP